MKKILLILLLAAPAFSSCPKYSFKDPLVNDEMDNMCHEINSVLRGNVRISSVTISSLTVTNISGPFTNWVAYTPTLTGFGTATNIDFYWKRIGDSIQIRGYFLTGTVQAVGASFTLPGSLVIDQSRSPHGTLLTAIAGTYWWMAASSWQAVGVGALFFDGSSSSSAIFFNITPSSTAFTKSNGANVSGSNNGMAVEATVPISGWSF